MKNFKLLFIAVIAFSSLFLSCGSDNGEDNSTLKKELNGIIESLEKDGNYKMFVDALKLLNVGTINAENLTIFALSDFLIKELGFENNGIVDPIVIKRHVMKGGQSYEYLTWEYGSENEDEINYHKLYCISGEVVTIKLLGGIPILNGAEVHDGGLKVGNSYIYTISTLIPQENIVEKIIGKWKYDRSEYSIKVHIPGISEAEIIEHVEDLISQYMSYNEGCVVQFELGEDEMDHLEMKVMTIRENDVVVKNAFYFVFGTFVTTVIDNIYTKYVAEIRSTGLSLEINKNMFILMLSDLNDFPIDKEALKTALNKSDAEFSFKLFFVR